MDTKSRKKITEISKDFTRGLGIDINKSGALVVDPLSAYLNVLGYENELSSIVVNEIFILIITFKEGGSFIPAGKDIHSDFNNYHWI